jgi:hypothetical protein
VRNLRVMQRIFYQPMREESAILPDIVNLLFPNIDEVFEVHSELLQLVSIECVVYVIRLTNAFE